MGGTYILEGRPSLGAVGIEEKALWLQTVAGSARSSTPVTAVAAPTNLPPAVTGTKSPKPTVVAVTMAHLHGPNLARQNKTCANALALSRITMMMMMASLEILFIIIISFI